MFYIGVCVGSIVTFLLIILFSSLVVAKKADRQMEKDEE